MKEGDYCEITVINQDRPELHDKRNTIVITDVVKL